jgi:hypothetical protein
MKKILLALCAFSFFLNLAAAATPEEDANRYIQIFNGDKNHHSEAIETLAWMGISDTRVYDILERRVLDEAKAARNDRYEKNRVALYIRALGFSGQEKYAATITPFLGDPVYERYAKLALEDIPVYRQWNSLLSDRSKFDPKYSDDLNRVLIMLKSSDFRLKKIGAKRVYFANKEDVALETLAGELKASYNLRDHQYSDAIAWMVKALGSSMQAKYKPLLKEVAANSWDTKVLGYANEALRHM